jgi:hypothetical protein
MSIFPKVERRFLAVIFRIISTIAWGISEGFKNGATGMDVIDADDRKHKASQEGGGK